MTLFAERHLKVTNIALSEKIMFICPYKLPN